MKLPSGLRRSWATIESTSSRACVARFSDWRRRALSKKSAQRRPISMATGRSLSSNGSDAEASLITPMHELPTSSGTDSVLFRLAALQGPAMLGRLCPLFDPLRRDRRDQRLSVAKDLPCDVIGGGHRRLVHDDLRDPCLGRVAGRGGRAAQLPVRVDQVEDADIGQIAHQQGRHVIQRAVMVRGPQHGPQLCEHAMVPLGSLLVPQIANRHAGSKLAISIGEHRRGHLDRHPAAVAVDHGDLAAGFSGAAPLFNQGRNPGILRVDDACAPKRADLFRRSPQHPAHGGVGVERFSRRAGQKNAVESVVDDRSISLLVLANRARRRRAALPAPQWSSARWLRRDG